MMIELLFDVMDRFLNAWISSALTSETWSRHYFNHRIEVLTPGKNQTVPCGTSPWGGDVPGTRAGLRSPCPSGTKAIRRSGALALNYRFWGPVASVGRDDRISASDSSEAATRPNSDYGHSGKLQSHSKI